MKRSSAGLMDVLFDEISDLRAGESTPTKARAVATVANSIMAIAKTEMAYQKHIVKVTADSRKEIPLGSVEALEKKAAA